jgi:HPt (histidine-containing phosphotransfer) domain-containing protein
MFTLKIGIFTKENKFYGIEGLNSSGKQKPKVEKPKEVKRGKLKPSSGDTFVLAPKAPNFVPENVFPKQRNGEVPGFDVNLGDEQNVSEEENSEITQKIEKFGIKGNLSYGEKKLLKHFLDQIEILFKNAKKDIVAEYSQRLNAEITSLNDKLGKNDITREEYRKHLTGYLSNLSKRLLNLAEAREENKKNIPTTYKNNDDLRGGMYIQKPRK